MLKMPNVFHTFRLSRNPPVIPHPIPSHPSLRFTNTHRDPEGRKEEEGSAGRKERHGGRKEGRKKVKGRSEGTWKKEAGGRRKGR
jgi:hypothetical protein